MKTLSVVFFTWALSFTSLLAQTSVPSMTGPSSPSGLVTQSGAFSTTYPGWQAFDSNDNSMWISAVSQTPAWIGYEFGAGPKRIVSYAIKYTNGSITTRAPKNWTLQAWNGFAWVVIDTRANQINWSGNEERAYPVSSPGFYSRYRLNITDDNDARSGVVVISIGKLSLRADDLGEIDWNQLFQSWHLDADQSNGTVEHFVPIDVPVPRLHFVPAMIFHPDGSFEKLILAPDDAHYYASGSWTRVGTQINTVVFDRRQGTLFDSFTVLTLTSSTLRIQR